jgi:outer membrane lipoprotein
MPSKRLPMNAMKTSRSLLPATLALALGACATVPTPLQGTFSPATPRDAAAAEGQAVRWGGDIIKVEPRAESTCFEVLARELDARTRPRDNDNAPSLGRFIACRNGFYDPEEFERGRDVTVVGRLDGTEQGKVGEFEYTYPVVRADAIYLWPKRPPYPRTPYYDPWMYGFGPYWGWGPYWGPYWGGPTVIVRDHPHPPRPHPGPGH